MESQKEKVTAKSGKDNPILIQKLVFPIIDCIHIGALPNPNLYTSTGNQGGITDNMNVQKYATLQLLQKMRDGTVCYIFYFISKDAMVLVNYILLVFLDKLMCIHLNIYMFQLREHCMLGDRSAQYEMEIQTILIGIAFHN